MERGSEGLFVVNRAFSQLDTPGLDLTLTNLEGCYQEVRNNLASPSNSARRKITSPVGVPGNGTACKSQGVMPSSAFGFPSRSAAQRNPEGGNACED